MTAQRRRGWPTGRQARPMLPPPPPPSRGQRRVTCSWRGRSTLVLLRRRIVVVSAVRGRCAVKGGIPQIGVSSTIAGQPAMTKRVADRANNNQPLRVEGGQAAACKKSSVKRGRTMQVPERMTPLSSSSLSVLKTMKLGYCCPCRQRPPPPPLLSMLLLLSSSSISSMDNATARRRARRRRMTEMNNDNKDANCGHFCCGGGRGGGG